VEKVELEPLLREYLSPKAQEVVRTLRTIEAEGAKLSEEIAGVKEEAFSAGEQVWACADGQGFITALMIDDDAISNSTLEELEDLISDTMIDASGRGQIRGEQLLGALEDEMKQLDKSQIS
jgi:DNA-binding protein YbaB